MKTLIKEMTETTEKIVIDYANLSCRESANRAEFRKMTEENLSAYTKKIVEEIKEEVKKEKQMNKGNIKELQWAIEGYNEAIEDFLSLLSSLTDKEIT